MSKRPPETLIQYIGELVGLPAEEHLSNRQLLEAFVSRRDQAAFTSLVNRDARLVYSVQRRNLAELVMRILS